MTNWFEASLGMLNCVIFSVDVWCMSTISNSSHIYSSRTEQEWSFRRNRQIITLRAFNPSKENRSFWRIKQVTQAEWITWWQQKVGQFHYFIFREREWERKVLWFFSAEIMIKPEFVRDWTNWKKSYWGYQHSFQGIAWISDGYYLTPRPRPRNPLEWMLLFIPCLYRVLQL